MAKKSASSSETTASAKDWKKIADLGNKISNELKAEPGEDSLRWWMAHRIAELLIQETEEENPDKKEALRKECTEVITRIWKIRKRFDPEDPISQINTSLRHLLSSERELLSANATEDVEAYFAKRATPSFLQKCDLGFALAIREREILRAAILSRLPEEQPDENEPDEGDKIDPDLYKRLIEARRALINSVKSDDFSAILEARDDVFLRKAVAAAISKIDALRAQLGLGKDDYAPV